jgi:hypothetical protein
MILEECENRIESILLDLKTTSCSRLETFLEEIRKCYWKLKFRMRMRKAPSAPGMPLLRLELGIVNVQLNLFIKNLENKKKLVC